MKKFIAGLFVMIITLTPTLVHAQEEGPAEPGGDPGIPIPIDGGASLLVGAAALYGIKKMKDKKAKQK